jgi:Sporulation and spore germination./Immunoglobulin-like domain of bacterial spore germination.
MRLMLVILILLFACRAPERDGSITTSADTSAAPAPIDPDTEPATATQATESQPAVDQEIYIDTVSDTNPLVVKGRARTFENAVSLRVRDARGTLLTERHVTSTGEMGHHNPYEAQLWLVRDPGGKVTVEAFEYSAKDGSVRSLTRRQLDSSTALANVVLMFPAGDCERLQPFTRRVPKSQAMARLLGEALVAGPTADEKASGASSPFPAGTELRSVVLRHGQLTVDFNDRLQNVGGSCAVAAIRQSVTQTLRRLPTINSVVITSAGREDLALQP